jgi:nitrogen fixation/metabolism regulation signal transduction histidine kinase
MKTLRSKIFIFIALLLLLPAVPLSIFIMNLLDRSYRIGVNEKVEKALDEGLKISADYYQLKKSRLTVKIEKILRWQEITTEKVTASINDEFRGSRTATFYESEGRSDSLLIPDRAVNKFLRSDQKYIVWSSAERMTLYALARIKGNRILAVVYPLPDQFRNSAQNIQNVSQMYKTLGMVNTEIRRSFLYTFLLIYGFGVVLALLLSYFISSKMTRPIKSLITATGEIASGNLDYRIVIKEKDEFRTLADAFNHMVAELSQNQRRIIELEKMATWQQMARRLAHEIKNPLTPIQLMAQQIVDKYPGSDAAYLHILKESYEIIEQEIDSLKKLVRSFSDFAKLPEFQPAVHDLKQLLLNIQKMYPQGNIRLDIPQEDIKISFDFDHLKRALLNLVDNALAAQNGAGPVLIQLIKNAKNISLHITDKGTGIDKENLSKIFQPYFSTKQTGVGLGLPIVKKIIEEHGGVISVKSQPQEGTTFFIKLPL